MKEERKFDPGPAENQARTVLVIGGGISGITAAVEAAEIGCHVYLVEKHSYLGGRVAQTNEYFPKLCPPYCGLEINFKRIRQRLNKLNTTVHTVAIYWHQLMFVLISRSEKIIEKVNSINMAYTSNYPVNWIE